ncbi:serine hydrolase domain-containing protein [Euryhalocaulis caribicus]|uniref:serine hydrolase domain-containing protein n=1 Tax=Euryhalocaulis caribicus TaxID=1161401 RepID=UPI0003A64EC1|nr:serine hydrolase domain-containing protein [Euryhalocaulis caribicus]
MKTWIGWACAAMALGACAMTRAGAETPDGSVATVDGERAASIDKVFESLLSDYGLHAAGAGVIRDGELVWTGFYGEESPGEPASADTLFNVASITKTVAAETMLRLAAEGRLDLDESMARYWVDPDIEEDPRHEALTARMALTHVTGFPNWRFFLEDGTLQFISPPGEAFGYSGEGFDYAMRYAEEKIGAPFDQLVREEVFEPAGMKDARFSVDETAFDRIARPASSQGEFYGYYCRPNGWCREPGDYSAADDMVTTVRDHAAFLISVMNADGYGAELAEDRDRVQSVRDENPPSIAPPRLQVFVRNSKAMAWAGKCWITAISNWSDTGAATGRKWRWPISIPGRRTGSSCS